MKWRPLGGRGGMAPFVLNLRAGHIEWWTSYFSQPLCQCLGVIASDTHWIGGKMDFIMTLAPAGFEPRTIASSVYWLHYFHPTRKHRWRNLWVTDSCKFPYNWPLSHKMKVQKDEIPVCALEACMWEWRYSIWVTCNMRLVVARSQFWCQLNEDVHLKIILYYVIFLQDTFYTCEVQGDPREPDIFKINSTQLFFK